MVKCRAAGIDYDGGLHRFGGKTALYNKYLIKFFDDPTFKTLGEKLAGKNIKEAFILAHSLKGMSGNLSLDEFYNELCGLVELLREDKIEGADEYYKRLSDLYERARDAVLQ
ncbi:MAG: Hpt domain-containing protein [Eubacteriales bacterium]